MMSRPLMTVDELKTMPRFHFIIAKTGCNPMKTKLDLFFKWGIELNNEYEADDGNVREVHYAGKDELIEEIEKREGIKAPPESVFSARRSSAGGGMDVTFAPPVEELNNPHGGGFRVDGQKPNKN